jgi:hypothetical protein
MRLMAGGTLSSRLGRADERVGSTLGSGEEESP